MKIKIITRIRITEFVVGHPRLVSAVIVLGITFAITAALTAIVAPHDVFARLPIASRSSSAGNSMETKLIAMILGVTSLLATTTVYSQSASFAANATGVNGGTPCAHSGDDANDNHLRL